MKAIKNYFFIGMTLYYTPVFPERDNEDGWNGDEDAFTLSMTYDWFAFASQCGTDFPYPLNW
jgi:hypothetical protein